MLFERLLRGIHSCALSRTILNILKELLKSSSLPSSSMPEIEVSHFSISLTSLLKHRKE